MNAPATFSRVNEFNAIPEKYGVFNYYNLVEFNNGAFSISSLQNDVFASVNCSIINIVIKYDCLIIFITFLFFFYSLF